MPDRRWLCLLPLALVPFALGTPSAHAATAGWQWPLAAPHVVVRGFEPPPHDWLPGHRGVDLAGRAGQPVLAAGAGTVSFAGVIGGTAVVAVRHPGGLETTYQPVRALARVGSRVGAGDVVGVLLRAGHCRPQACLHWGLRRGDAYLDPLILVGQARVRLLPLLSDAAGGSWLAPAVSGASVGSSVVAAGWAGLVLRRRRRRLPPGVVNLSTFRRERQLGG